jgi:hypothetical protein
MKTLVVILSETRASELTFKNIKKNLIDTLQADLCICIGIKCGYNYDEQFYKLAKYRFTYDEPKDYGDSFEYAYNIILNNIDEKPENPVYWREFLKIKDQFLGGVKDKHNQHPGSAGILIFFRWFLLKNLIENDLISKYDRFVITRSDFIYELPHPKLELMNENNIWIPDCEHYKGYTDRHVVLSKTNIEPYLNILNNLVFKSHEYFNKMKNKDDWNLEQLIKFNLQENKVLHLVKEFPYIMYSVRAKDGTTRWSQGNYNDKLGYYIKYSSEYDKAMHYKKEFEKSGLDIDKFYEKYIMEINNKVEKFTLPRFTNRNKIKIIILSIISIISIIIFIYIIKRLK